MALDEKIEQVTSRQIERCTLSDSTMEPSIWSQVMNSSIEDDLSTDEINDLKEHFSGTERPTHFSNVDELINDLDN